MQPLIERITRGEIIIFDGALGTMIQSGPGYEKCPEEINLTSPDTLVGIAAAFLAAGSDIVTANTFGASRLKLEPAGLADRVAEINIAGVETVREAVGKQALVAASCGPSGRLMVTGEVTPEALEESFEEQVQLVAVAGADLIIIETMTDLIEAMIAVRTARRVAPDLPVIATMTFDPTPQGFRTIMGVSIEEAVPRLHEAGADIVGSNCGHGMETMIAVAREFRRMTDRPLIIQPNAGIPRLEDDRVVYPETPADFAAGAHELAGIGVEVIGGCCGSTPDHIRAICAAVQDRTTGT